MARPEWPALRARREDIFAITAELSRRAGAPLTVEHVEVEATERLLLAPWPSNVRELDAALATIRRLDPEPGPRLWAVEQALGAAREQKSTLTTETVEAAMA